MLGITVIALSATAEAGNRLAFGIGVLLMLAGLGMLLRFIVRNRVQT